MKKKVFWLAEFEAISHDMIFYLDRVWQDGRKAASADLYDRFVVREKYCASSTSKQAKWLSGGMTIIIGGSLAAAI
jgi:hypothetical protein